jgi:hypothetical protein
MADSVLCPCCHEDLYTTAAIDQLHRSKIDGPELQQSDNRIFMICPNCQNEIDFVGSGQLSLSPVQPCNKGKK